MKNFISARMPKWGLPAYVLVLMTAVVQSQTPEILVNVIGNGPEHTFTTTNLGSQDRVFYRFSDGYFMEGQQATLPSGSPGTPPPMAPGAQVTRVFPNTATPPSVVGYVARKNGPLLFAHVKPGEPPIQQCSGCQPPVLGLSAAQPVRLKSSWMPFTSPVDILTDNTTSPMPFISPDVPWLLLAVTIKVPAGVSPEKVTVNLPGSLQAVKAIVEDKWGDGQAVANTYVHAVNISPNNPTVDIFIKANAPNNEFNVYLVVKSESPQLGEKVFSATFFEKGLIAKGSTNLRLPTRTWPHDPNALSAFEDFVCKRTYLPQLLGFWVDFQNVGKGVAEDVMVRVNINSDILDYSTVAGIETSDNFTGTMITTFTDNTLIFKLPGINLPGVDQAPPVEDLQETTGWIKFLIQPKDCIPEGPDFYTDSEITFFAHEEPLAPIRTNRVIHTRGGRDCIENKYCDLTDPTEPRSTGGADAATFAPRCYPTLFTDRLTIETPVAAENQPLTLVVSDLTGKQWIEKSWPVNSGEIFRQELETSRLPEGVYLVHFIQGAQTAVYKILKNRL